MKKIKLISIAFGLSIMISIVGCTPQDTGLNTNTDRLSTQTRINRNNNWNTDGMGNNGMGTTKGIGNNDFTNGNTNSLNGMNGYQGMNNLSGETSLNNGMTRNNSMTNNQSDLNNTANQLAKKISDLPEVNNASVVLSGNNCLVGLSLKGSNNNNTNVSTALRQKIEKMVKDTSNTNATNVSITADPNLLTRIQSISNGMMNSNGTNVNGNNGMTNPSGNGNINGNGMGTNLGNSIGNGVRDFTNDIEDIINSIVNPNNNNNINNMR